MALRISNKDYEELNPGQTDWDQKVGGLNKAEQSGTVGDGPDKSSSQETGDNLKGKEENPGGDWANNFSGKNSGSQGSKGKGKAGGKFSFLKKKGPLTTIILTVAGGGIGIGGLLSPGLLIIHLKEVMVSKFNTQLTSMDIRTTKILTKKATGGACGLIKISCKYSSISEKQISKFAKAGITVKSTRNNIIGRSIPDEFEFEGKTIKATDFSKTIKESPGFRTALKKAYNPKFAGFADNIFTKVAAKLRISKKAVKISGDTDENKLKSIQEQTKSGDLSGNAKATAEVTEGANKPGAEIDDEGNPAKYTQAEVDATKAGNVIANDIGDGAIEVAEKATKVGGAALALADTTASVVKITGIADNACTVYGMVQALGYAAKTVRAVQLARYAILFLKVADQIKAGDANPEDVSYLGGILTMEVMSTVTKIKTKSATDSFGYKFAAYGEKGKMSTLASQFLAGGGLTGNLINITSSINGILGDKPREICGVLKNPFVGVGSAIVGIASMTTPIGWGKVAGQAVLGIAMSAAAVFIPQMLKDIVAGVLVDKNTFGESAGDAITSGSSGLMGTTAATGGNAPLTVDQAVAYQNLSNSVLAQYAEEDRLAYSPFDISNKNTFMGSIVFNLIPKISKMSSLSGTLTSLASIVSSSLSSISPITKAADDGDFTMCQDYDYKDMGLATDPYCNVSYGIPVKYLDKDPADVSNALAGADQIDKETGEIIGSDYKAFLSNCINRTTPLGDSGDSSDPNKTGKTCLINDEHPENENYYLYYIDQRVEKGMDGEDPTLEANSNLPDYGTISFYDSSLGDYTIGSDQTDETYASISTSDINIVNSETEGASAPTVTTELNNKPQPIIISAQNINICNPTSISNRTTDFSYLCMQPYFNKEYIGV